MYIRSEEAIEYSKVARYEPRATGRTSRMLMSIPTILFYNKTPVYIVGLTKAHAKDMINRLCDLRGDELRSRSVPVGAQQAIITLRGVDPFQIFIDHTALEYGNVKDIKFLYSILDAQNIYDR